MVTEEVSTVYKLFYFRAASFRIFFYPTTTRTGIFSLPIPRLCEIQQKKKIFESTIILTTKKKKMACHYPENRNKKIAFLIIFY